MNTTPHIDPRLLVPSAGDELTALSMLGFTIESWLDVRQRYGAVFRMHYAGRDCTVICGHEADLEAWKRPVDWHYGSTDNGAFFRTEMGEDHVTQLDGEPHRRHRKLVLPAFGVKALTRDLDAVIATLEDGLGELAGNGPVDLHPELAALYTRSLARSQVKTDAPVWQLRRLAEFEEAFIAAVRLQPDVQARWHRRPSYLALKNEAFALFERIVAERRAGVRRDDSLDLLLERDVPDGLAPLSDSELTKAVYLLLAAGVGNIANLVCAAVWALDRHAPWMERLRAELSASSPQALANGVGAFPVLRAVVSEVERRHLPAPVIPKTATRDIEFLGCRIPEGELVLHLHGLGHFEAARYPDPLAFRPERWLGDPSDKPNAFGGGKHLCLGMGVARLYMPLTLALIAKRYDVTAERAPSIVPLAPDVECSPPTTRFGVRLTER